MSDTIDWAAAQRKTLSCRTSDEVMAWLNEWLAREGVTLFAFSYYGRNPRSSVAMRFQYSSPALTQWHRHFKENQYDKVDSTMLKVFDSTLPVYWSLEQQLAEASSDKERIMRQEGLKLGVVDGISIPIHGPSDDFATLTIQRHRSQLARFDVSAKRFEWMLLGHCVYQGLRRCLLKETPAFEAFKLSSREMQCLRLVAENESVEQMAKKLCLTERTVNFHIQNANKKLGVHNKHESVRRAQVLGLLA